MVMLGCFGFGLASIAKSAYALKTPPICHKHYFRLKEPVTSHIFLGHLKKKALYLRTFASKHCFIKCNKQRLGTKLGRRKATSTLTLSISSFCHSIKLCRWVTFYCKMWRGVNDICLWMSCFREALFMQPYQRMSQSPVQRQPTQA